MNTHTIARTRLCSNTGRVPGAEKFRDRIAALVD
jgi:hypothetical protein